MRLRSCLLLATTVALVASLPACLCGRMKERLAEKATEAAFEAAADDGKGGKAKIDLSKGTLTVTDGKGGGGMFAAGAGTKLPDSWPKDFPVAPGAKVTFALDTPNGASVTCESVDPPAKVYEFYAKTMAGQGWKINVKTQSDDGGTLMMTKDPKRSATVVISGSTGKTNVVLSAATSK
jgi:hypothetical protein